MLKRIKRTQALVWFRDGASTKRWGHKEQLLLKSRD